MTVLKHLRESSSLSPEQLAAAAGLNLEWYYDLETYDDELTSNVSLGSIARVAKALGVRPSALYGGEESKGIVSLEKLALLVRDHVQRSGKSIGEFETKIGWSVSAALADPEKFREFNFDGLRATCEAIDVNWCDVLDGL
jgi:transcriptional regulator with XRE-family HTH domain